MKDQLRLLRDCINNDRPAVVFQGDDFCAPEILEAAKEIFSFNTHLLFFRQRIERDGIKMLANLLFSKVPANS